MALKNPLGWFKRGQGKVVTFPAAQAQAPGAALPVAQNGQTPSPHEFLQAQIVNAPQEEESLQKRALLELAYFAVTWGGSLGVILLGIGLAQDLQTVFQVSGLFAVALAFLFPFAELAFVCTFGAFTLLANASTAMLQVFLLRKADAVTAISRAGVQYLEAEMNARRTIDEHDDARKERERKEVAFNEMQAMMREAFDRQMERLRKLDEDDTNGNGRRGRY